VSVARFIADQRTKYIVPHMFTCVLLGVSVSPFYDAPPGFGGAPHQGPKWAHQAGQGRAEIP
jgi:hypothetical protein